MENKFDSLKVFDYLNSSSKGNGLYTMSDIRICELVQDAIDGKFNIDL